MLEKPVYDSYLKQEKELMKRILFILAKFFLQGIHVYVVVQIDPWFNLYFLLFQNHYHALPYPKTKENKI